jgi:protein-glutamine gamma-glutamyltransferase
VRFSQIHKFSAYTLAVLGLVALGAGGELPVVSVLMIAVGVVASWFAEGDILQNERYHRVWNGILVVALCIQVLRYTLLNAEMLLAFVEFGSLVQIMKLSTRRSARDYQHITVLALLQLIASTVLGGGISYALCFTGFVIATPWAMTLGHLRREIEGNYLADARAGRAGVPIDVARILRSRRVVGPGLLVGSSLLAVPIFLLTAVIFVMFPRIGLGIITVRGRGDNAVAGFGTSVDLRGHGTIRTDATVVLRVEPLRDVATPPPIRTFRLRGVTFDRYTGRGWSRSDSTRSDVIRMEHVGSDYALYRMPREGVDQAFRIMLDPLDPPVVPLLEGTVGLRIDARYQAGFARYPELTLDRDDGVRYPNNDEVGLNYIAYVGPHTGTTSPARRMFGERDERFRRRYLQLPTDIPQRVRDLATQITNGETTVLGKSRAIERYLANHYRYTLTLESGQASNPLDDFLFRSRAGHCEYFSTAMAVMLRTLDVPTRNVTGFLGGIYNRYGHFYEVHQGDSHSWVEVWDTQLGWVTYDPTPSVGEVPFYRRGVLAEVDAMVEAMSVRWRRYIVDFDLKDQTRIAQDAWQYYVTHRRPRRSTEDTHHERKRNQFGTVPVKKLGAGAAVLLAVAALAYQIRQWKTETTSGSKPLKTPTIRAAQDLCRALDATLSARGTTRPLNKTPMAFARELERRRDPFAALYLRVADRYMSARFGDQTLTLDELTSLRAELKLAAREIPQEQPR